MDEASFISEAGQFVFSLGLSSWQRSAWRVNSSAPLSTGNGRSSSGGNAGGRVTGCGVALFDGMRCFVLRAILDGGILGVGVFVSI